MRFASRRGTGLVEVLVAAALVLLLAAGAAELAASALRAKRRGDVLAALTRAAGDRLETLRSRPFDAPDLAAGAYAETLTVGPGACRVAARWEIADDGDDMKRVTLRLREAGRPGPETVAVLFISRDLGFKP